MPISNDVLENIKKVLYKLVPELETATDKMAFKIPKETLKLLKDTLSPEALDIITNNKLANIESETKSVKDIFYNFFAMNENWPLGRNIVGGLMVHCPEWPTYFIPSYTQAKATGDAGDLKKGEGARGIITGGLEGIAVGALVSGRVLKIKEMVPYIILGAALQLFSSKLFPWLGEKVGRVQYDKLHPKPKGDIVEKTTMPVNKPANFAAKPIQNPMAKSPAFKSKSLYSSNSSNRMKV